VAVSPGLESVRLKFGGDEDSRHQDNERALQGLVGLDLPAHLETRHIREHDIEKDNIRAIGLDGVQAFSAGGCLKDLITGFFEEHGLEKKQVAVVVGNKHIDVFH